MRRLIGISNMIKVSPLICNFTKINTLPQVFSTYLGR